MGVLGLAFVVAAASAQEETPGVEIKKLAPRRKSETPKYEVFRKTDRLKPTDPQDPARPDHYAHVYTRKLEFGRTYMIELSQVGGGWDPYLRLEDAAGAQVMQDDDGGGSLNARIVYTPTATADFKIYATTFRPRDTGEYELKISPMAPGTSIPGLGMPVQSYLPTEYEAEKIRITALPPLASFNGQEMRYGYVEYRFTIENESEKDSHEVTLALPGSNSYGFREGQFLSSLKRSVVVGPQMGATISLFQPAMAIGGSGARVTIDGRPQENGVSCALVSERGGSGAHRYYGTKSTVGGPGRIPVLTTMELAGPVAGAAHNWAQEKRVSDEADAAKEGAKIVLPPGVFPKTSPPGVAIEPGGPFDPMMKEPGFKGARPPVPSPLNFIMATRATPEWSASWLAYTPFAGVAVSGKALDDAPHEVRTALFRYVESGGALLIQDKAKLPPGWKATRTNKGAAFYNPGFGQCIVADPKSWQNENGAAIQDMFEASHNAFNQIVNLNEAHRLFPVVENSGVPVRGLFIFMFLFVILIGPVNIIYLAKTNRRIWLLWTVPAIALATSAMLFTYMRFTEGWYGHVRSQSLTVLDETSQRAVTTAWLAYYSPATPSGGLHFSATAELTPQNDRDLHGYRGGGGGGDVQPVTLDWTDDQHLASGWITPRVPLHLLVRNNVKLAERVSVEETNGKPAAAVNLLGSPIAKIYVAGGDGKVYTAENIAAGAKAALTPSGEIRPATPAAAQSALRAGYSGSWLQTASKFENNPGQILRPGTYLAVVADGSPYLDDGMRTTQSRKARSLVYGILPVNR